MLSSLQSLQSIGVVVVAVVLAVVDVLVEVVSQPAVQWFRSQYSATDKPAWQARHPAVNQVQQLESLESVSLMIAVTLSDSVSLSVASGSPQLVAKVVGTRSTKSRSERPSPEIGPIVHEASPIRQEYVGARSPAGIGPRTTNEPRSVEKPASLPQALPLPSAKQ